MHHPGRLETPLDDAFSDAEDCMELPEAPGMVGDSVSMAQGGAWGHKGRALSTIPVLPAIQQKKRVSIMQQPTMFEMPGESGIEHAL